MGDEKDVNGWRPIHEAARAGQTESLEFLLSKEKEGGAGMYDDCGVDVNIRTGTSGLGGWTSLALARDSLSDDHPTIQLLRRFGGFDGSEEQMGRQRQRRRQRREEEAKNNGERD